MTGLICSTCPTSAPPPFTTWSNCPADLLHHHPSIGGGGGGGATGAVERRGFETPRFAPPREARMKNEETEAERNTSMTTLNASVRPKAHHFPKAQPMTSPTKTMAEYAAEENKRMRDNAKGERPHVASDPDMRKKVFAAIKEMQPTTSKAVADETGFSLAYVSRILGMEYRAGRLTRERAHRVDPYLYEVAQ